MNPNIQKLFNLAKAPSRTILGLMSGTSLDGLDMALCRFTGAGTHTVVELLHFETANYSSDFVEQIRKVFAKDMAPLPLLAQLNEWVALEHARLINQTLAAWGVPNGLVDCVASHGQTVMHSPKRLHQNPSMPNATLQIGDGDHLAVHTGILTLSDFRQKHLAHGGEAAPLALYGDYLLFSSENENRVLVNIGGIANFTWLPAHQNFQEVFATDTGPGNTLLDAFTQKHFGLAYDADASLAKQGKVEKDLLKNLKSHPYFTETVPKTTGPELFNLDYISRSYAGKDYLPKDVLATLARFTAETLVEEIERSVPEKEFSLYLSGGGAHNPLVVEYMKELLPNIPFAPMARLGIDGDAKEAVLFAALANETLAGEHGFVSPLDLNKKMFLGKVSFAV